MWVAVKMVTFLLLPWKGGKDYVPFTLLFEAQTIRNPDIMVMGWGGWNMGTGGIQDRENKYGVSGGGKVTKLVGEFWVGL